MKYLIKSPTCCVYVCIGRDTGSGFFFLFSFEQRLEHNRKYRLQKEIQKARKYGMLVITLTALDPSTRLHDR